MEARRFATSIRSMHNGPNRPSLPGAVRALSDEFRRRLGAWGV